ncbi:MAG: hypothetical protein IH851_11320 [Armatimonadetes bacterium]|nr:hypothetical protein [Armatimonadota bacterium]
MADDTKAAYTAIRDKYANRIEAIMIAIADALHTEGYTVKRPSELTGEQYVWNLHVKTKSEDLPYSTAPFYTFADVRFEINESEIYNHDPGDVAFRIAMYGMGGEVVVNFMPYDCTEDYWVPVDDTEAVERRFCLIEGLEPVDFVERIREGLSDLLERGMKESLLRAKAP